MTSLLSHQPESAIIKNLKAYTPQSCSAPLIQELESSSFEEDAVSTYIEPLVIADLQKPTKSQSPKRKVYTPQSSSAPLIQELESSSFEEDAVSTDIEPLAIADLQKPTKSQSQRKIHLLLPMISLYHISLNQTSLKITPAYTPQSNSAPLIQELESSSLKKTLCLLLNNIADLQNH
ncbi:hypothetical protein CEXT_581171 [Caerostris extrusa]|uniref:Uncharacterized protein n=1 Tax=Caerostris extrusa TaxID=172846 RepID=A0AAV4XEL9_CAEEX|nr:hypothetical protein CEXT_581171 [Caerostris extrusa]